MRPSITFAIAASSLAGLPAVGHHSEAGYDAESVAAFEGTVTHYGWRNPHVYVTVEATTRVERSGDRYLLETELENNASAPALAVRVVAVRTETGDRILPALYSDNFVFLMPGERQTIRTELRVADARGEEPRIVVEGFNLAR